jgi:hydroxyacylglutathione hydrolase
MPVKLLTTPVGPWAMNTYVVIDESTQTSAVIDPGGDPDKILEMAAGTRVDKILITHGHDDHILALDDLQEATGAPVYLHPADAAQFGLNFDVPFAGGETIQLGTLSLKIIHTPGHTPGQCCIDLGDGRILVGDTIFVGGPGRTDSPKDFAITMQTMRQIIFAWPDKTGFFPGHGPSGKIGAERPSFEAFVARGWPEDTHGDVTWD